MRTADAVTPMPGLRVTFTLYTSLYIFLGVTVGHLIWRQVMRSPTQAEIVAHAAAAR
jgi:cytochrome d ubiquinol oxidase subunit I